MTENIVQGIDAFFQVANRGGVTDWPGKHLLKSHEFYLPFLKDCRGKEGGIAAVVQWFT